MVNMLSHGLVAGAVMALANLVMGLEPISWNVFLAVTVAVLLNLDSGGSGAAPGSPLCHSVGCGIFMLYVAGVFAYLAWTIFGMATSLAASALLGIGAGITAHLFAETVTGEQVFTVPVNMKPMSWFVSSDAESTRIWSAWGRFRARRFLLRDVHLNGISILLILSCIFLFRQAA